jgi:universal stress protein A
MAIYTRILVAVDLAADSLRIARHASDLASALGAQLHVVHVVRPMLISTPMPPQPVAPDAMMNMVDVSREAQRQMGGLATELGLSEGQWQVIEGNVQDEILRAASELAVDLIVIGNREQHGLALLRRPTDDAVAQRAPCDVLEVRLRD